VNRRVQFFDKYVIGIVNVKFELIRLNAADIQRIIGIINRCLFIQNRYLNMRFRYTFYAAFSRR
jgi:hypothetical protein